MATAELTAEERVRLKLRDDLPYWAENFGKIVNKKGRIVPFEMNEGQLAFDAALEEQKAAGKPMRGIVLKARQIGFSTLTQGKLIQRTTQRENHHAAVVAHDRETGAKLYAMGDRFYRALPDDKELGIKPRVMGHRRQRYLHFGEERDGMIWPDSSYLVDTANEFHAGRGSTYHSLHLSEFAFWADPETKLTALLSAVPDDPDTLAVIESTANGNNYFKNLWDRAEAGESDWVAFFWPWHKHAEYSLPFANEQEREEFRVGEGNYGEDEIELVEKFALTKEQLHWRRWTIRNKFHGKIALFKQEFPSTPEEAFITSGRQVFDSTLVQGVLIKVQQESDAREPPPGPELCRLRSQEKSIREGKRGRVEVPKGPLWIPRSELELGEDADWKIWEKPEDDSQYVIGVDVSGGFGGVEKETDELAFDAIQIVNHETREQAAEFSARLDADLLAEQVYLAALSYNSAWVAIEVTGNYGRPVARRVYLDYRYPFCYFKKKLTGGTDRHEDLLGWDTTRATKPMLEATMTEMLREGTHGIKSRALALEMKTHVRDPKGKTHPEAGKFNDRLMAYMIAQQVAALVPVKRTRARSPGESRYVPRDSVTGY